MERFITAVLVMKSVWVLKRFKSLGLLDRIGQLDEAFLARFAQLQQASADAFQAHGIGLLWKLSHPLRDCLMPFLRITAATDFPLDAVRGMLPLLPLPNEP